MVLNLMSEILDKRSDKTLALTQPSECLTSNDSGTITDATDRLAISWGHDAAKLLFNQENNVTGTSYVTALKLD